MADPTDPLATRLQELLHQYCEELAKTMREMRPQLVALAEELRRTTMTMQPRASRDSSPDFGER